MVMTAALAFGLLGAAGHAQQLVDNSAEIPDAPSAVAQANQQQTPTAQTPSGPINPATGQPKQTKRILGIIPNFRAVSADQRLAPQTAKDKLWSTTQQSFDYSSFFLPIVLAAYGQSQNSTPEFHQGAAGYGRYFWHSFVDQTSENYFVQAFLPIATHEDSRYYTLGHGGFVKRGVYAFSRVFITRTDADTETFNFSEIVGAGAASGVSDLYYPSRERTWTKTGQKWLTQVSIEANSGICRGMLRHRYNNTEGQGETDLG